MYRAELALDMDYETGRLDDTSIIPMAARDSAPWRAECMQFTGRCQCLC